IGGPAYLLMLISETPTHVNVWTYATIVQTCGGRLNILEHADYARKLAVDESTNFQDVLVSLQNSLADLSAGYALERGNFIGADLEDFIEEQRNMVEDHAYTSGVATGFQSLDDIYHGLHAGDLVLVAGRPGMGKSALLLNIILNIIICQKPVVYFSTELTRRQVLMRLVTIVSGVPNFKINNPRLRNRREEQQVQSAIALLKDHQDLLYIDDTNAPKPFQVRMEAQRLQQQHDICAVFVDGVYRMKSDHDTKGDLHRRYGNIAEGLKNIARELDLPVIATHQLSRAVENRQDKRPVQSDLRESGRLEEEADIIWFVYREVMYDKELGDKNRADIICGKHRNGEVKDAVLHWDGAGQKFTSAHIETIALNGTNRDYSYEPRDIDI
ncbi:MAG: replicative DNA helicase, partial [Aggregatilineales bacterium]